MTFQHQRGQAILGALMLLMAAGVGTLLYVVGASSARAKLDADTRTASAMAQAKEALIGWKLNDTSRPGVLPCPDTDNNGIAEAISGNECPSYIGRLPWKSLGLPELRDGSGEILWYALSRNFRNDSSAEPINTDTKGTITVYGEATGNTTTSEAAAVIFAAGTALSSQDRTSTSTASCTVPPGTITRNLCAANYLETAGSTSNAAATGPYIAAQSSTNFNDRLLVISAADVMVPVEKRAAREIITLLQTYRNSGLNVCFCYPWGDNWDGVSNANQAYGRVPLLGALPLDWSALSIAIPPWLINNQWWWVFFYTVSGDESALHTGGSLRLDGVNGYNVVLIATGTTSSGTSRPLGAPFVTWSNSWWSSYIEDGNNSDLGTSFSTPSSTAFDRDRLYTIP